MILWRTMALLAYFICFFLPSGNKLCYYLAACLDQMTDFTLIWCEHLALETTLATYQFTTLSNNMADARTSEVGHRLAQFNTAPCFEKL
jgi:hypothetical protein